MSWFGDEDAARRRQQDHSGRGPSNYTRSDERIREDVCDRLGATNDGERAAALELALEGLYLARRIGKDTDAGETVYG